MGRKPSVIIAIVGIILVAAAAIWLATIKRAGPSQPAQFAEPSSNKAAPPAAASPADDGNWTMPGKDYASTRYSALNQITPANVAKMGVAFTFSTGTTEGFEAPPLVVNNTMYVVAPWPNNVFAD